MRGREFVLHGTDSEEEDEDDDEDEGWETDDDAVDGAEWADEEAGGPPRPPVGGARQRAVGLAEARAFFGLVTQNSIHAAVGDKHAVHLGVG